MLQKDTVSSAVAVKKVLPALIWFCLLMVFRLCIIERVINSDMKELITQAISRYFQQPAGRWNWFLYTYSQITL